MLLLHFTLTKSWVPFAEHAPCPLTHCAAVELMNYHCTAVILGLRLMKALYAQSQKSLKCWSSSWVDWRTSKWYGRWGGREGVAGVSLGASTLSIWRCRRLMRDFISRIISINLGNAGWWCFFDTLLSHSKWCSYSFRSACNWDSVGFSSRLVKSLADLLLISGRDLNLWGSTSASKACSLWERKQGNRAACE